MILMFSLVQLSFIFSINEYVLWIVPSVLTLLMIIGAIILSFTTGQGGARIQSSTDKAGHVMERDDDQYWKLGQFYFNKDDPSIFLEKRFGVGWKIGRASCRGGRQRGALHGAVLSRVRDVGL